MSERTEFQKGAFSVDEFCAWASIGRSKFYDEVTSGRINLRKIGRKSVVTVADAYAWLASLPLAAQSKMVLEAGVEAIHSKQFLDENDPFLIWPSHE